jgi:hypothetical protein
MFPHHLDLTPDQFNLPRRPPLLQTSVSPQLSYVFSILIRLTYFLFVHMLSSVYHTSPLYQIIFFSPSTGPYVINHFGHITPNKTTLFHLVFILDHLFPFCIPQIIVLQIYPSTIMAFLYYAPLTKLPLITYGSLTHLFCSLPINAISLSQPEQSSSQLSQFIVSKLTFQKTL